MLGEVTKAIHILIYQTLINLLQVHFMGTIQQSNKMVACPENGELSYYKIHFKRSPGCQLQKFGNIHAWLWLPRIQRLKINMNRSMAHNTNFLASCFLFLQYEFNSVIVCLHPGSRQHYNDFLMHRQITWSPLKGFKAFFPFKPKLYTVSCILSIF